MRASASSFLFLFGIITQLLSFAHGMMCTNGLAGVQSDEVCCLEECGICGGVGCSQRPGGPLGCCMTELRDIDTSCSDSGAAPCIIDDYAGDYSYALESWGDDEYGGMMWCSSGIPGIMSDKGEACCPIGCGQCGGPGCSSAGAPDYDAFDCCVTEIMDLGESCAATGEAPCYNEDPADP
ncbi:unnamed protein product [Scytosiphon promiscuus]